MTTKSKSAKDWVDSALEPIHEVDRQMLALVTTPRKQKRKLVKVLTTSKAGDPPKAREAFRKTREKLNELGRERNRLAAELLASGRDPSPDLLTPEQRDDWECAARSPFDAETPLPRFVEVLQRDRARVLEIAKRPGGIDYDNPLADVNDKVLLGEAREHLHDAAEALRDDGRTGLPKVPRSLDEDVDVKNPRKLARGLGMLLDWLRANVVDEVHEAGDRRLAYERDHQWLDWYEIDGLTAANIRGKWNGLSNDERKLTCGKLWRTIEADSKGRRVVETALHTAAKDFGRGRMKRGSRKK